jgi:hypothetical protein
MPVPLSDIEIPTHAASLKLPDSKHIPAWMLDAQRRFELVFSSEKHKPIIKMWLEYKALLGYPDDSRKNRLTNKSRPQQVYDWMQRHRLWDKAPPMDKSSEFGALWKVWWALLQPEWRIVDSLPLLRKESVNEGWENLMKGGGNGFVLVILSLSWWMMQEKDETRAIVESSAAFEDVEWALQQMLHILRARREEGDEDGQVVEEEVDPNVRPKKRCV